MEEARNVRAPRSEASRAKADAKAGGKDTRNTGPGRLLIAVYAVFAISATARAGYQILTAYSGEEGLAVLAQKWRADGGGDF